MNILLANQNIFLDFRNNNPKLFWFYVIAVILLIAILIISVLLSKKTQKEMHRTKTINYGSGRKNYLNLCTKFFRVTPGLKTLYKKTSKRISMIYPADHLSITKRSTVIMLRSLLIAGLIMLFIIVFNIVSGFDIIYLLTGLAITIILFNEYINGQCEKKEFELLKQFGEFLSDVRHNYHTVPIPDQAVYDTIDHVPDEIALHAAKFHEVLSSTNPQIAASNYADMSPNRFFTTFVAIGSSVMEFGTDKENDSFLKNLEYLKEEVDIELLKKEENDHRFSGLMFVSLIPIFFLKPVEWWVSSIIPELSSWYEGLPGTVIAICMIPITILCYQLLNYLKHGRSDEIKEHKVLEAISNFPIISQLLNKEINRNYTKNQRIGDTLKLIGDSLTPKQFIVKRLLYGIITILLVNALFITSDIRERSTVLKDFTSAFENSIVPNKEYRETMTLVAKELVLTYKDNRNLSKEDITEAVLSSSDITNPTYAEMIADLVLNKINQYRNIYYKYQFLIISLLAGIMGYNFPYIILNYRKKVLSQSMADEVNQFHTLILILMNQEGITIDIILDWMERFAYCFKASIQECSIALERGEQDAILDMKLKETYPAFRRYCDKLLSVDAVGVKEAFDEIDTDRAYYIQKRTLDNKKIMDNKSAIAKMVCFIPLLYIIFLQLILPFTKYFISMMDVMNVAF